MHAMAMMPVSRRRGSGCIGEVPLTQAEALAVANEGNVADAHRGFQRGCRLVSRIRVRW